MKDENSRARQLRQLGLLGVIVSELIGLSGAGIGLGYFLWKKCGAPGWILILTSLLGLSYGFYRVYLLSKKELE